MATTKFIESGTDATQDFTFYQRLVQTTGTVTSDSTQSEDGPRSIKANVTTSGGTAHAATPNSTVQDAGALISCWIRISTASPATAGAIIIVTGVNDGTGILALGLNTNGTLQLGGRGTTAKNGSTVLSANTWYRISLGYIITSSTSWSAVAYINGVSEVSTSNTDGTLTATGSSGCSFGMSSSVIGSFGTPPVMTVWVDSIYIDNRTDKSDCGNVHVTAKRPNANGTSNQFTTQIGSGGSGYGSGHSPQVNEQPLNTANGWSLSNTTKSTEEYNIESASTGDVDISTATLVDYMGWIYTSVNSTSDSPVHHIVLNNVATSITESTSNTMFTVAAGSSSYPAGSGTDIGMDAQYTTNAHTTSLYECGVVFAYTPATTTTSTSSTSSSSSTSSTSSSTSSTSSSTSSTSSSSSTSSTSSSSSTSSTSSSSSTSSTSSSTSSTSSSSSTSSTSSSSSTSSTSSSSSTSSTSSSSSTSSTSSSSSSSTSSTSSSSSTSHSTSTSSTSSSTSSTSSSSSSTIMYRPIIDVLKEERRVEIRHDVQ